MPTGTVTFKDGTTILGTGTVNSSGQATFSTSALSGGRHTITASYGGDENFNAANGTLTQTVGLGPTVRITSSASSAVSGQSMTFTATVVASTRGSAKPTGKVTFMDGNTVLGTGTLSASGVATLKTKALGAGSHTITVNYGGDTNFVAGTANLAQKVNQDATTISLVASVHKAISGQPLTLTATVKIRTPGSGTPTGTVTFMDGTKRLGTGTLNASGQATLVTSLVARPRTRSRLFTRATRTSAPAALC